jgi:hypothetical protein
MKDFARQSLRRAPERLLATATFSLWICLALPWPACAALESGVFQTLSGATVEERGDRVTNRFRIMPISATMTFDLGSSPPSLTAVIPNAVLEGGDPFAVTVRSTDGAQHPDGTWHFRGDYLGDFYPSGSQYLFDWGFTTSTNGDVVWNGHTGWAGGHLWVVTMSNLTLVPGSWLSISLAADDAIQITWATNFADHLLEHTSNLLISGWATTTNALTTNGNRFFVTFAANEAQRFYRLRKL